jgi:hypothetical protein
LKPSVLIILYTPIPLAVKANLPLAIGKTGGAELLGKRVLGDLMAPEEKGYYE